MKLELQDIDKEMKNADDQLTALKDKITQEEKELERLTQASDAAKVTAAHSLLYSQGLQLRSLGALCGQLTL